MTPLLELVGLEEVFWSHVDTGASEDCWVWQGEQRWPMGYGIFRVREDPGYPRYGKPEKIRAHRMAWALAHGMMPPRDMDVCHHCDNPPCVNPTHLFLGTRQDNNADRKAKGRYRRKGDTS